MEGRLKSIHIYHSRLLRLYKGKKENECSLRSWYSARMWKTHTGGRKEANESLLSKTRFNSWGLFPLSHAHDKKKNFFLDFFTELKADRLFSRHFFIPKFSLFQTKSTLFNWPSKNDQVERPRKLIFDKLPGFIWYKNSHHVVRIPALTPVP